MAWIIAFLESGSQNDMITLLEGNYTVNGSTWATGKYIQEKASLKFTQNVQVSKDRRV